jgi:hypothetical protein
MNKISQNSCKYKNKDEKYRDRLVKHLIINILFFIVVPLVLFAILHFFFINTDGLDHKKQREIFIINMLTQAGEFYYPILI